MQPEKIMDKAQNLAWRLAKGISFHATSFDDLRERLEPTVEERLRRKFSAQELGVLACYCGREVVIQFKEEISGYDAFVTIAVEILLDKVWEHIQHHKTRQLTLSDNPNVIHANGIQ